MRKLVVTFAALLGFAMVGAATPAVASEGRQTSTQHCIRNLDTGRTTCASSPQQARQLSDATLASLTIAIFYDGTSYTGATFTWVQSRQCTASYDSEWQWGDLGSLGWNNRVSSVHTYNQCDVKFYDGTNFTGASSVWIDQSANLAAVGTGWSNRASSVKFS